MAISEKTRNPILTIVMPFFNKKELVIQMVDSILSNSFTNWELLAIDDGSAEEDAALLQERYKNESRILFSKRNVQPKGAQTCRNLGLEKARGIYVCFFDSDDFVMPFCLKQRVDFLDCHQELDFAVFPSGTLENDIFSEAASTSVYGYPVFHDDIKQFARRKLPFIVWNNIYRTASLRNMNANWDFHLLSLQDADFNLQTLLHGLKYDYALAKPDYGYRISSTETSISKELYEERHFKSHIYATNKYFESVQGLYGHKYDYSLYLGALYIYNKIFTNGINFKFAHLLADTVKSHSKFYGNLLMGQIFISQYLGKLFPPKRARQIPMACYLIWRYFTDVKTRQSITTLIRYYTNKN